MNRDDDGRTVSPKRVDVTLRDGRVSIDGETRTASLTARPASHKPLSEDGAAARIHLVDGDVLDVEVTLKAADVAAIRDALDGVGAAETFEGS